MFRCLVMLSLKQAWDDCSGSAGHLCCDLCCYVQTLTTSACTHSLIPCRWRAVTRLLSWGLAIWYVWVCVCVCHVQQQDRVTPQIPFVLMRVGWSSGDIKRTRDNVWWGFPDRRVSLLSLLELVGGEVQSNSVGLSVLLLFTDIIRIYLTRLLTHVV